MADRQLAFAKSVHNRTGMALYHVDTIIALLRSDDDLMAEFMALCARHGPSDNDSDFEYVKNTDDPLVRNIWVHGGSGLPATHHIPEPANPT